MLSVHYQCIHNQHGVRCGVMLSTGDNVPFLTIAPVAGSNLDGSKICAKISG